MQSRLTHSLNLSCVHCMVTTYRQKRAELREYKKKKALKKKEKLEKIEVFREKEKDRWKDFTHKVVCLCAPFLVS